MSQREKRIKSWWLLGVQQRPPTSLGGVIASRRPISMQINYIREKVHEPDRTINVLAELPLLDGLPVTWQRAPGRASLTVLSTAYCLEWPLGGKVRHVLKVGPKEATRIAGSFGVQVGVGAEGQDLHRQR